MSSDVYPPDWHRKYGDKTSISASRILPPLIAMFGARSMVEVGCGNGHWTQVGLDAGIGHCRVVDGPWNNRDDLLIDRAHFFEADLAQPLDLGERFDLAVCLEVAEHVRADAAEVIVKSLVDLSDVVIFGAAIPLQGGFGHINEQWPSYWRDLFARQGYRVFDLVRPAHWHDSSIHYWYRQNTFVYVRETHTVAVGIAAQAQTATSEALFDAVHPEKFYDVASYNGIAMKRLLKRIPSWTVARVLRAFRARA